MTTTTDNATTIPNPPATPETPETKKNWFARHKVLTGIAGVAALVLVGAAMGGSSEDTVPNAETAPVVEAQPVEPEVVEAQPVEPEEAAPETTLAQDNALRSAESYLEMSGFSRSGLIDQLSSEYGDDYSVKDATWAVDHVDVDWNEQAVRSAESYLEMSGFSRSGLIDQLSSEYGDQYTVKQATYAADAVGL